MDFYTVTDKGDRKTNEDFFIAEKIGNYYLFGVADGIASLYRGDFASKLAITELADEIQRTEKFELSTGFNKAHYSLLQESKKQNICMGTTLVAGLINKKTGEVKIAHVGDSRAYIFNKDIWKTKDHTLVQDLVDLDIFTEETAFSCPEKTRMKQALGTTDAIKVDTYKANIKNSTLLLSSDGLHDYVKDEEIKKIIKKERPKDACEKLIKLARKNESKDDITIVIVKF